MATLEGSFNGLAFGAGTRYHVSGVEGLWDADGVEDRDLPRIGNGSFVGRDRQGGRRVILTLTLRGDTPAAYDTLVSDLIDATEPGAGDNLLTAHQASIEDAAKGTTGWTVTGSNTTIARSTAQANHGVASLAMTAVAAGDMQAITPRGTAGVPVVAGRKYVALAHMRPGATARTVEMGFEWWTAEGVNNGFSGSTLAEVAGQWQLRSHVVAAPAKSAFAVLYVAVRAATAGEIHYVDKAAIHQGTSTTWTEGGNHMRIERPLRLMGNTVYINARPRRRIIPIATDQQQRTGVVTVEFHSTSPAIYTGAP